MKQPNRERKGEIKAINAIQLDEQQKEAKRLVIENQIVLITGKSGSGKSLVAANVALDLLAKKMIGRIKVTRSAIEVGRTLGYLRGDLVEKFNPYMEALLENLNKCCNDKAYVEKLIENSIIEAMPVQFIRGKTVEDILIVEEAQNLTKHEMLAILTRLGKNGRIVINGDNDQQDIRTPDGSLNGLQFVTQMSKYVTEIKHINLKGNHRSDLVGKILEYEYGSK